MNKVMEIKFLQRNYFEYVAVFIGHLGVFIAALSMTWTSPILPKLRNLQDNPLDRIISPTEQSLLGSIPIAGTLAGTFLSGHLAKTHGRRPIFLILGALSTLSFILMALSTNIWELLMARILAGFTMGGFFTVSTMYFAEISQNSNRGMLGTAMSCLINFGLLFVLAIGPWTPFLYFHVILALFPAGFMALAYVYLPESPYFLVQKDYEEAEVVLKKLRGLTDVTDELNSIKECLDSEQVKLKDILNNKGLSRGLVIGCGLVICQQLSGTAVIMSYGQLIFDTAGGNIPSEIGPIIIAGIQFIFGFLAPSIVEKSGRKSLLLVSYIGVTIAHLIFGSYFFIDKYYGSMKYFSWVPLACLILYIITYSLGSGPLPWTIIGEIFPMEVKNVATSVCITTLNIFAFIFLFTFHFVENAIGIGNTFWIFSVFGVLSTVFTYFCVLETKGKSLSEIQKILNKSD